MSKTINVLITIDTDKVQRDFPKNSNSNSPTQIPHNEYGYMVVSGTTIISGQGTGDVNFNALVGDVFRAFAVSGSNNFEDAVLLYGLPAFQGTQVMSPFSYLTLTKPAVLAGTSAPLPPQIEPVQFSFFEATVVKAGTEGYQVQFGLWTRDPNTDQPVLYGYYQWDPTITVVG